jgi:hypothetical protein
VLGLLNAIFTIFWGALYPGGAKSPFSNLVSILVLCLGWYSTFFRPLRYAYSDQRHAQRHNHQLNHPNQHHTKVALKRQPTHTAHNSTTSNGAGAPALVPPEIATFAGLLAHSSGRLSFEQHLALEFSVENLMFVEEVEALQRWRPDPSSPANHADSEEAQAQAVAAEAHRRALAIYERFVGRSAPYEVSQSVCSLCVSESDNQR